VDWSFYSTAKNSDVSAAAQHPSDEEAQDWVSPILNREIRTRIGAHDWGPTITPYNELCEIYTLLQSQEESPAVSHLPTAVQFLDLIASPEMTASILALSTDVVPYSMSILSNYTSLSQSSIRLLEYMVQMRMASPSCELQRTLFESIARGSAQHVSHTPYSSSNIEDSAVTLMVYDDSKQMVRLVDIPNIPSSSPPMASEETEESLRQWWDQTASQFHYEASTVSSEVSSERVLPGEVVIPSSTADSSTVVIMYGFLGSPQWADVYRKLRALPHLQIVVRHRGIPPSVSKNPIMLQGYGVRLDIRNVEYKVFDDRSDAVSIQKNDSTIGDLLNVSHIVADRTINSDDPSSMFQYHHPTLAGVDVTKLLEQDKGAVLSKAERMHLEASLWKIHDAQMLASQIIPPIWQRRQLSLQAATVISEGKDPLYSLQYLSQNLPSVASTLVHVKVPDSIVNASTVIAKTRSLQSGLIYLNGRAAASLERPTFNVFELLHQISQEQAILRRIQSLFVRPQDSTYLPPFDTVPATVVAEALRDVQKAWMLGRMFGHTTNDEDDSPDVEQNPNSALDTAAPMVRIDVGRGWKQAVIYLNDIEKDPQYMSWPRSLRQMLMSMQFGMPPTVRRNLFTILAVVDPVQSRSTGLASSSEDGDENETVGNVGFDLGMQLIQAQYPARIGVLVASVNDIEACADWIASSSSGSDTDGDTLEACPVPSIFSTASIPTNVLDLRDHPATTHAIHRLIASFASNESNPPGALIAYGEYLLSSIRSHRGSFSLYDLVTIHGSLWEGMQIGTSSQGVDDGFQALIAEESSMLTGLSYGRAVRFAADKRLHPGMSFINGRLLSIDSIPDETVSTTFSEEQNHVFGLIMKEEITDTSPKSIYAKLLSGAGLHKKYHPLLSSKSKSTDTESDSPQHLQHQFSAENSLLSARKAQENHLMSGSDALFVVDVFLAYDTKEGLDLAAKFMSLMNSFPSSLESSSENGSSSIGVVYRFMPSSTSTSKGALCPILAHAGLLGAPIVERLLHSVTLPQDIDMLDSLLNAVDGISDDVRATILANSGADGPCATMHYPSRPSWSFDNSLVANGRIFHVEGKSVVQDDLELLLSLEMSRTKAVTKLLRKYVALDNTNAVALVGNIASFLMGEESQGAKRYDIDDSIDHLSNQMDGSRNPLAFAWNTESSDESSPFQVSFPFSLLSLSASKLLARF
jgi:Thioredoxin-like domain